MVFLIQMSFKFPPPAAATNSGIGWLIRFGTSCVEDVSPVAVK
jgi:hypothetical protein